MLCYPENTDWSCYGNAQVVSQLDGPKKKLSEARAWYALASMTAFRIGVCPTVVRPCAASCAPRGSWIAAPASGASYAGLPVLAIGGMFTPYITGGNWVNGCGCGPIANPRDCGCKNLSTVYLPGPVGEIEYVMMDGMVVLPYRYRVDNGNELVAVDPTLKWPVCQDMAAPAQSPGSFVVSYYRGMAPNELTRSTAGILAAEFYKACTDGKNCRLPQNVKTVARYGTQIEINPDLYASLMVIPEVAMLVNLLNPNGLKQAPRVLSPDGPPQPRRTTVGTGIW
jgi:hypothetical protein